MPIKPVDIFNPFDIQRFDQLSTSDLVNWYIQDSATGKKKKALYPTMGRAHVTTTGVAIDSPPRKIYKSIDYFYIVVRDKILRGDRNRNLIQISDGTFTKVDGHLDFDFLPVVQGAQQVPNANTQKVFCGWVDGTDIFFYDESANTFSRVTDLLKPPFAYAIAAFGNRFVVSTNNSTQFQLTTINLASGATGTYDALKVFSIGDAGNEVAIFAQESGLIRAMCVLHQQLYIFTDYTTGIWSNTTSLVATNTSQDVFPWKKNTSYDFDYGIADPNSLAVNFGMMCWLSRNQSGLVKFMMSNGQSPQPIEPSQAVSVLLQTIASDDDVSASLLTGATGFLYQYEDSIFYRVSFGDYTGRQLIQELYTPGNNSVTIEYCFNTQSWHRSAETNGSRNIINGHEYYNNKHLVICQEQAALFQMAGNIYFNEFKDTSSPSGFTAYPMRYENVTPIICEEDYSEFVTDWLQVDFVWGLNDFIRWEGPYSNAVFIIDEVADGDGNPIYLVAEDGSTYIVQDGTDVPALDSETYSNFFKPNVELYFSDDGGITYHTANNLEFSQRGIYSWRIRWYQLGPSRNRVYKLICVSPAPMVILGAIMSVKPVSGGAR